MVAPSHGGAPPHGGRRSIAYAGLVMPVERRRTPNIKRFLITGVVLGFLAGAAVAVIGDPTPSYAASSQLGYLGVMGAALGVLLAGVVAVLLDRRR